MKDKKYVIVFYKAYDVEAKSREEAKAMAEDKLNIYLHDLYRPSDGFGISIKNLTEKNIFFPNRR